MDQWDRFAEQNRGRSMGALGFADALEVYEPTESYTAGEGYSISYPSTPTATVDAEITTPDSNGDRDEGGTTVDADVVIYVPDDTGLQWTGYGESGDAAARVEDVETGTRYELESTDSEHNGQLRLEANEV